MSAVQNVAKLKVTTLTGPQFGEFIDDCVSKLSSLGLTVWNSYVQLVQQWVM